MHVVYIAITVGVDVFYASRWDFTWYTTNWCALIRARVSEQPPNIIHEVHIVLTLKSAAAAAAHMQPQVV